MKLKSTLKALATALPPVLIRGLRAAYIPISPIPARPLRSFIAAALILHFTLYTLYAPAAEPLSWERTPNRPAPAQFDTFHGQSLDFRCTFTGFGALPFGQSSNPESSNPPIPQSSNPPIIQSSNAPNAPRLYYQTNGMGAAWWSIPATVSSNVLAATFPPSADPGAERLTVFFGAPSNAYAAAQVRFRNSPGAHPNDLDPPSVLDWQAELSSATNSLMASITSATNSLAKSLAPTISNTVTKAYVESLGIDSGVDAQTVTNMTALTPVYSDTPTFGFGDWSVSASSNALFDTDNLSCRYEEASPGEYSWWLYDVNTVISTDPNTRNPDATKVEWTLDVVYTATRELVRTDIIGYTIGNQTNSVLAATNGIVTAETATNIAFAVSADATNSLAKSLAPTITNTVTKAYVESLGIDAGISTATATNISETITAEFAETGTVAFANGIFTGYEYIDGSLIVSEVRLSKEDIALIYGELHDIQSSISSHISAETATNIAFAVSSSAIEKADTTYLRTIGLTNLNQSVQYVNITDHSPTTLAISMPMDGVTKDWIVYVVSVTNVSLSLPSATWWMADTTYTNDVPPATPTAFYFSQITDGVFFLGRQELTPATITTEE